MADPAALPHDPATGSRRPAAAGRLVGPARAAAIRADSATWRDVVVEGEVLRALELIATGALQPLDGFMGEADIAAVRGEGTLADGTPWPAPVVLPAPADVAVGTILALRDAEGDLLAAQHVEEVVERDGGVVVAGPLEVVQLPVHHDLLELRLTPEAFARDHGAVEVVVTDRPLDAGSVAAAGQPLHVIALQGPPDRGRVDHVTLVAALRAAGAASVTLVPRPPGATTAAWAPVIATAHGATPAPGVAEAAAIGDDDLAHALARGEVPGPPHLPAAVQQVLHRQFPPPGQVGFTVLLTGLSGSGKSTVAAALADRLRARGHRRVTLLDGDLVRRHLSSELGFSREHRDLNVTRIGYVAAEVTRHGGIAICAPIAPYDATRQAVRDMVEAVGRFVLVHVATPLEVCEARDRKGLYAKARAGLIGSFTGISDPYEEPADAEVAIDTTTGTPGEAATAIEGWLEGAGLLAADEGPAGRPRP